MNPDLFNRIPVDPEWAAKADTIAKEAAAALGCMVCLVAVQDEAAGGKLACIIEGQPGEGPLRDIAKQGGPQLLFNLAGVLLLQQRMAEHEAQRATKQ